MGTCPVLMTSPMLSLVCGTDSAQRYKDTWSQTAGQQCPMGQLHNAVPEDKQPGLSRAVSSATSTSHTSGKVPSEPTRKLRLCHDASSGQMHGEYLEGLWKFHVSSGNFNVFEHDNLRIANDGGVRYISKLLYPMQYVNAMTRVGSVLVCTYAVCNNGIPALSDTGNQVFGKFLIVKWLASWVFDVDQEERSQLDKVVPAIELFFLARLYLLILFNLLVGALAPRFCKDKAWGDMIRWTFVAHTFWNRLMRLSTYSAMQLLHRVTPYQIALDAYTVALHAKQRLADRRKRYLRKWFVSIWSLASLTVSRTVYLMVGFDAFLIKCRTATAIMDSGEMTLKAIIGAGTFLFQILCLINLEKFSRDRIQIFMFGGKAGNLDADELALLEVYNGLLAMKIYEHFGWWKGTIVMLGFDDFDFQMLALDDDEQTIREEISGLLRKRTREWSF